MVECARVNEITLLQITSCVLYIINIGLMFRAFLKLFTVVHSLKYINRMTYVNFNSNDFLTLAPVLK